MKIRRSNEEGSVLIFTLLILVLVTIAGISGLNTTDTELIATRNTVVNKQNLYAAEGATNEGMRTLRNLASTSGSLSSQTFAWLQASGADRTDTAAMKTEVDNLRNMATWTDPTDSTPNTAAGTEPNTSYRIIDYGASAGESIALNNSIGSIKHDYVITGRYNNDEGARRGDIAVEKGYKIRVQ